VTAPVIANAAPVAEMLINAVTGSPYRINLPDASSTLPIANVTAPLAIVLIDPVSGVVYRL
jgi:hypothetical protein